MSNLDEKIGVLLKEAVFSITNLSNPYDEKTYINTTHANTPELLKDKDLQKTVIADMPEIIKNLPKVYDDGNGALAKDLWVKIPDKPTAADLKRVEFEEGPPISIPKTIKPFVQISVGGASAVTGRGEIAAYLYFAGINKSPDKSYDLVKGTNEYISVKYSDEYKGEYPRLGSGREEVTTSKDKMQKIWNGIGNPDITVYAGRGNSAKPVTFEEGEKLSKAIEGGFTITGQNILDAIKTSPNGIGAAEEVFRQFSNIVLDSLFAAEPKTEEESNAEPKPKPKWLLLVNRRQFIIHQVAKNQIFEKPPVKFLEITSGRTRFAPLGASTKYAPDDNPRLSDEEKKRLAKEKDKERRQQKKAGIVIPPNAREAFRAAYGGITIQDAINLKGKEKEDFLKAFSLAETGYEDEYDNDQQIYDFAKDKGRNIATNFASTLIDPASGDLSPKKKAANEALLKHFVKILLA